MMYMFGEFTLDERLYRLCHADEIVPIEPQVFKLLLYLITHRNRVVPRDELFDKLWPGQVVGDAALTYCVAKARKAVQDSGVQQRIIKTVHGHGYRFIGQVFVREVPGDTSVNEVRVPSAPASEFLTPPLQPMLPVVPAATERHYVFRPSWQTSRQSRQLALVGCLFVFGWVASLWQVSGQSPWKFSPLRTAAYYSRPDVIQTEGKLCHWWALSTQNQPALDVLLQGWTYADRSTPEAKTQAHRLFQRAIELDPTYAAAYASLGWLAWRDWLSWSQDPHSLEQASLYVQKAVALDSSCPHALTLLGDIMLTQRRRAQAMTEVERSLALPSLLSTESHSSLTELRQNNTKRSFGESRETIQ